MRNLIFALLIAILLGECLAYLHDPDSLKEVGGNLLTITFALASFSVMFSMSAFSSSPYRQFHRRFPRYLLWGCVFVLVIALVPLVVRVLAPSVFFAACLLLLPLLSIAGVSLLEIVRRETDPLNLLERLCSVKIMQGYLISLVPEIADRINETEALKLSQPADRPNHEWGWHLPVLPRQEDNVTHLATLGLMAIQQGDLYSFARIVKRSLEVINTAETMQIGNTSAPDYRIRRALREHVFDGLQRMVLSLQRDKGTASLARVALDTLAEFIVSKARTKQQTEDICFTALRLMEDLARHCYECGSRSEVRVPLIVARQIVQKGVDDPPHAPVEEGTAFNEFFFRLPQLIGTVQRLGSFAIERRDTNYLYLCLDAFCWLGCSAVKQKDIGVTTACLRAISQLGREARASSLECHWDRCALRPEDHASERIDWIASWVCQMPAEARSRWIELLNSAASRLRGYQVEFEFQQTPSGEPRICKRQLEEKHVEGYFLDAGSRQVDYSDFEFLKDLELHGGRGIMQGPVVPIAPAPKPTPGGPA